MISSRSTSGFNPDCRFALDITRYLHVVPPPVVIELLSHGRPPEDITWSRHEDTEGTHRTDRQGDSRYTNQSGRWLSLYAGEVGVQVHLFFGNLELTDDLADLALRSTLKLHISFKKLCRMPTIIHTQ